MGHAMNHVNIQHALIGGITYVVLLVISLFLAAVFWSCIAPDQFYHMYYDAPLITFIPPFSRNWADPTHGGLRDYFIWPPWIVYFLWFVFVLVAFALPALAIWVLHRHGKLDVRWFRNPTFIVSFLSAIVILYVLSLGPLLCLCGDWERLPRVIQRVFGPLYSLAGPQFETVYGQYLMWWINLQYWRHW
jgi:hypothetical protein